MSCLDSMGHVQQKPGGFQTGPAVAKDLRLKAQFQRDALLVSRVCEHPPEDEDEDLPLGACRGLVQDFPTSKISKQSKATRYLKASPQEQQSMQESAKENCTFCSAPLFPLSGNTFFEDNLAPCEESEFEEFFRESSPETFERVTGNVCGKGHLTFAINHYGDCLQILQNKPIMGTGEQLWVETFKVFKAMVEAFEGELDSDTEIDFRKNLDAFTVSRKLRRLAAEIEYEVSDEEDTLEELRPLARLQTMPELINGVPEIARRTCKLIKDFEDGCEDSFESESEFESEEEEEFDDVRPFWEVPADEIDVVRDFLSTMSKDWVGILATYLGRKMLSARTLLSTVRQLEQLNSIGEQATHRLAEMEAHRKAVIEGALEEAGVCKRAGAWPIPEAVYKFVKVRCCF